MPNDDYLSKLSADIKRELLFEVIMSLRKQRISISEAHYLASDFLKILPAKNTEDFFAGLSALGKRYSEVLPVYLKHVKPYEEIKSKKLAGAVAGLVKA